MSETESSQPEPTSEQEQKPETIVQAQTNNSKSTYGNFLVRA